MKVLFFIDFWLLNKFQTLQDKIQDLFGLNCFWIAKKCALIAYISYELFLAISTVATENNFIRIFDIFIALWWTYIFFSSINKLEKKQISIIIAETHPQMIILFI